MGMNRPDKGNEIRPKSGQYPECASGKKINE